MLFNSKVPLYNNCIKRQGDRTTVGEDFFLKKGKRSIHLRFIF